MSRTTESLHFPERIARNYFGHGRHLYREPSNSTRQPTRPDSSAQNRRVLSACSLAGAAETVYPPLFTTINHKVVAVLLHGIPSYAAPGRIAERSSEIVRSQRCAIADLARLVRFGLGFSTACLSEVNRSAANRSLRLFGTAQRPVLGRESLPECDAGEYCSPKRTSQYFIRN
jgi:hypothetical protein